MNDRIAFLEISSYAYILGHGLSRHYYGMLRFENKQKDVQKVLTQSEADFLNKIEGTKTYEAGSRSIRCASESEVIQFALSIWKDYFPRALILVKGRHTWHEPQWVLDGPEELVEQLNDLYKKAEQIGWWDKDVDAMKKIHDKWYALLEKASFQQDNQDKNEI